MANENSRFIIFTHKPALQQTLNFLFYSKVIQKTILYYGIWRIRFKYIFSFTQLYNNNIFQNILIIKYYTPALQNTDGDK